MSRPSSVRPLSVEERLRIIVTSLNALQAVAHLFDEPGLAPALPPSGYEAPPPTGDRAFVKWTALMTVSIREQVDAIDAALPVACTNLEAPTVGGEQ